MEFDWKADILPLRRLVDSIRSSDPALVPEIADAWLVCALIARDPDAAKDALIALGDAPLSYEAVELNHLVLQGMIARMTNDDAQARAAFTAARAAQEKIVDTQPNYGPVQCVLGLIDAGLGRREEALQEGRRAVELLPVEKDAINGPIMIEYLAMIAAWVGDNKLACEQLAISAQLEGGVSYGKLKLLPYWESLRGDPRFQKIVNSLAPK